MTSPALGQNALEDALKEDALKSKNPFQRGWDAGYAAGYARAQQDIRMALGCKA